MSRMRMRGWKLWLAIGIAGAAVAVVGGPYIYIHFIEGTAPAPLALSSPSAAPSAGETTASGGGNESTDGTWKVVDGSVVGYRVKEVLFGQSNDAVGRTNAVNGSMAVTGTTVTTASFTVDMSTVTSDQTRRDNQFNGRIMETGTYPTSTFTLTEPIELGSIPAEGVERTVQAKGDLTLHGETKTVEFELTGRYSDSTIEIAGSIPITFADWNIPNPSFGPVSTEDHGVLEFALSFNRV